MFINDHIFTLIKFCLKNLTFTKYFNFAKDQKGIKSLLLMCAGVQRILFFVCLCFLGDFISEYSAKILLMVSKSHHSRKMTVGYSCQMLTLVFIAVVVYLSITWKRGINWKIGIDINTPLYIK